MLGTAAALRATWPAAPTAPVEPGAARPPSRCGPGHVIGLGSLYAGGGRRWRSSDPDSSAANLAPWLVPVVWWVGLPIVCLLLGDVVRHLNPFVPRRRPPRPRPRRPTRTRRCPTWTAAAFLAAWSWYLLAYHRPGSPRALAVFLVVYALAAVAGGLSVGPGVARARARRSGRCRPPSPASGCAGWRSSPPVLGAAALMIVWIGGTAFDGFTYRPFWQDVLGTSIGWTRTLLNTAGVLWITAIVAGGVPRSWCASPSAASARSRPRPPAHPAARAGPGAAGGGVVPRPRPHPAARRGPERLRARVATRSGAGGTSSAPSTTRSTTRSSRSPGCRGCSWP